MLTPSRRHNDHSGRSRSGHLTAGRADHIGESARGYQAIFVPSTALASPGYDGQPAVYLYIAFVRGDARSCRMVRVYEATCEARSGVGGIMRGGEQVKFAPLPCDCFAPSG